MAHLIAGHFHLHAVAAHKCVVNERTEIHRFYPSAHAKGTDHTVCDDHGVLFLELSCVFKTEPHAGSESDEFVDLPGMCVWVFGEYLFQDQHACDRDGSDGGVYWTGYL